MSVYYAYYVVVFLDFNVFDNALHPWMFALAHQAI